ncbi:MAG: type II toxin-antitoxin system RelE/ParE family toxin [Planctomycetes bacterium]|nr:type II toxin-antitoxin system RelE/ParE family toxin [Planctomycetota bacterium]MBU4399156.1 type II toxin-antitoxin system RelE/ParE family toxin [Planctomycetota bacterium]MCG2682212.1 type II toxin-antitoxin system RelE/ParE family toxin [Planctomycetales bacterium]
MRIDILAEAEQDLLDGIRFYDRQSPGVGFHFLESLLADIESLRQFAGVHVLDFGYYRMLARRFPYAIFYRIEDDIIRVHAVLDCRRNPTWIRKRLTNK